MNIIKYCKKELLLNCLVLLLYTTSIVLIPIGINLYVKNFDKEGFDIIHLSIASLIIFGAYLIQVSINVLWQFTLDKFAFKYILKLKEQMKYNILNTDYKNIENIGIDKLKSILFSDSFDTFRIYGFFLPKIISSLLIVVTTLVYSFIVETSATLILLYGNIVGFIILLLSRKTLNKVGRTTNKAMKKINASDIDFADNIIENKVNNMFDLVKKINEEDMNNFKKCAIKEDSIVKICDGLISGYNATLSIIISLFVAYISNKFNIENILYFSIVSDLIISYCSAIESNVTQLFRYRVSIENIKKIMLLPVDKKTKCIDTINSLKFVNVSFKYNEKMILSNFNLYINDKGLYQITGPNGIGKSTIIKLLMNIYNVDRGNIYINDIDINNILNLKDNIIYIGQDEKISNGNLLDYHKRLLKDKFDYDKYIGIINSLGIDLTKEIENNGLNLSLGQRKKILLVKLLYSYENSNLIILDEIFAGLDINTKNELIKFIDEKLSDKIIIIVDHENNLKDKSIIINILNK
jgi:ABC-type multidrug transport system fused ATPase/permease subunit